MLQKLAGIPRSNINVLRFPYPSFQDGGRPFEQRRRQTFLEALSFESSL